MDKPKGIFLAYRGNGKPIEYASGESQKDSEKKQKISPGKDLSNKLYEKLKTDFDQNKGEQNKEDRLLKYGEVYLSEKIKDGKNFKTDLADRMKKTRIVFMPMTPGFFDGFEVNGQPNPDSVTRIELEEALKNDDISYICVHFKGFSMDQETIDLLNRLYGKKAERICCAKPIHFRDGDPEEFVDEEKLLLHLGDLMVDPNYKVPGFHQRYENHFKTEANVFLTFKKDLESDPELPLYKRLNGVKQLTMLNFASTSFISGVNVASIYESHDWMRRWFDRRLADGNVAVNMILTNPHSFAASDAAAYKMRPRYPAIGLDEIILFNLNKLIQFKRKNKNARLNIYLTDIALPYGIMESIYHDSSQNHMKIDLYAPCACNDDERPSFFLSEKDPDSQALYSFFQRNLDNVLRDPSTRKFDGHPSISALLKKPIMHRGHLSTNYPEHTKSAFECCIQEGYPIEVDLIRLKDGLFVIGREDENQSEIPLSETTAAVYYRRLHNDQVTWPDENETLTLDEFLELVHGSVPVLLEIKVSDDHTDDDKVIQNIASSLVETVRSYLEKYIYTKDFNNGYVAFHSSDYRVLKAIKEQDVLIPCGIITMDFNKIVNNEKFLERHNNFKFWDDFDPDFISTKFSYLTENNKFQEICKEHKTPVLGWTIKTEEDKKIADYYCDNLIVDGAELWKRKI